MSWAEFWAMGGYGLYVWTSYLLAGAILIINVLLPLWRGRAVRRRLREFYRLREDTR